MDLAGPTAILRPSTLARPERVAIPFNWGGHIPFAFWMMDVHRPQLFVELGTHTGVSYSAFIQAVGELGLSTDCYAIDTWQGDEHSGFYSEDVFEEFSAFHAARHAPYSHLLRSTFDAALPSFAERSIDLLHIDGRHDYASVRHDFEMWLPKLSDRGVVLFHDIGETERGFGVHRLWGELTERHASFAFTHAHGLGVLGVGGRFSPELRWLFEIDRNRDADAIGFVRSYFEVLGNGIKEEGPASRFLFRSLVQNWQELQLKDRQCLTELETTRTTLDDVARRLLTLESYRSPQELWQLLLADSQRSRRIRIAAALRHPFSARGRAKHRDHLIEKRAGNLCDLLAGAARDEGSADGISPTEWLRQYRMTAGELETLAKEARVFEGPKISVIMPVYDPPLDWLTQAIESVRTQIYPNWELLCIDDCSPSRLPAQLIGSLTMLDRRIKLIRHAGNKGVSAAINSGLAEASGEYVIVMDHDDALEPHCLYRFAVEIARSHADLIYADEVLTAENDLDTIQKVTCRPAFSHDYYLSHPYFVHPIAVRREIASKIGGFDETLSISHDVDYVLRALEHARAVSHIPDILYRWRIHGSSLGHGKQHLVTSATCGAITAHLSRLGYDGAAEGSAHFNLHRYRYSRDGAQGAKVAILIPTKNKHALLSRCLASLAETTKSLNADIYVIDHESDEDETIELLRNHSRSGAIRVIPYRGRFNYSQINNYAVSQIRGCYDHYLFLNNDTEALSADWLSVLVDTASRPDIGAVGATLVYPDHRVQHAGVVLGLGQVAEHAFKFVPFYSNGLPTPHHDYAVLAVRDCMAVTGACMLVRADVFDEVDGFDPSIEVGFGDTDLCLRIRSLGYRVVNHGEAVVLHYESATRDASPGVHPHDTMVFRDRHSSLIEAGDPFFSPFLSLRHTDGRLNGDARQHPDIAGRRIEISLKRDGCKAAGVKHAAASKSGKPAQAEQISQAPCYSSGGIQSVSADARALTVVGWCIGKPGPQPKSCTLRIGSLETRASLSWQFSPAGIPQLPGRASDQALYTALGKPLSPVEGHDLLVEMAGWEGDLPYFFGLNSTMPDPPREMIELIGGGFAPVGFEFLRYLVGLAGLTPESAVLDLGCGCGRLAFALAHYLAGGNYYGFDIVPSLIDWCHENISASRPNFVFTHADLRNAVYNPTGRGEAERFRFPVGDETIDVCVAASLFTHLRYRQALHYFNETARVLKPGGRALFSAFVLDAAAQKAVAAGKAEYKLDVPVEPPHTYSMSAKTPEQAMGYVPDAIGRLAETAGLTVEAVYPGFWVPREMSLSLQELVVLRKPLA